MAGNLKSLLARMILAVLLIHALVLPLLSYAMIVVVRNAQEEVFIDHVRIYSRVFADWLQAESDTLSDADIVAGLDSSILGGRCVYAALSKGDRRLFSSLTEQSNGDAFKEDFEFGDHDDSIYFISTPLRLGDEAAVLQLGFDENPTLQEIANAEDAILLIIVIYLLVTIVLVYLLSLLMSRPLNRLRHDSHKIASGDYSRKMTADSSIFEISELSHDLDNMRSTLVGINARLEGEIVSREAAEAERRKAEIHLRHMHRLQSIGTLAGGVAHEFNNVLLPLLLYTDLALEDLPADSPVRPNLERVTRLANRAKGLSEQILTFGRPSGETMSVLSDLAPIIDEATSMVSALIPKSVAIETEIEHPLGPVSCNPNEIQQLLVNLCSNAFQAMLDDGGEIRVSAKHCEVSPEFAELHPRLEPGDYVCLTVTDTGEGMDAETLERVFDPFFTTREVGKGTGLGLSVVHGIVVKHNGGIVFSSEVNVGTTVAVYLPLSDE